CFFFRIPLPPRSPLFPYTTLFRSSQPQNRRRNPDHRASCGDLPCQPEVESPGGAGSWRKAARTSALTCRRSRQSGTSPSVRSARSEEHTSELQSRENLVCRLLLEK